MATFEELDEKAREGFARSMHKLLSNPEVSEDAKRLLMRADPSLKFPSVQAADAASAEFKKRDDRIGELEGKLIEQEARARLNALHQQARDRGLDPAEVEKVIEKYKMTDWTRAMELTEVLGRSAPASAETPAREELPKDDQKKLWNDPDAFARDTAKKMLDEFSRVGPRRGTRAA